MDATIHHWKTTGEVDSKGYYVLKNSTLTKLRFFNITDLQLVGFNRQNVLVDIEIAEISEAASKSSFSVSMLTNFGCEASFKCERICVISAVPYKKQKA
jgi:hypothetical protein